MEQLVGARIALTPRPLPRREAVLEVAMLGHCPGRVRLDRLLTLSGALADLRSAGFGGAVDELLQLQALLASLRQYGASVPLVQAALTLASRRNDLDHDGLITTLPLTADADSELTTALVNGGFTDVSSALNILRDGLRELTGDDWLSHYDQLIVGVQQRGNGLRAQQAAAAIVNRQAGLRAAGLTNPLALIDTSAATAASLLRAAGFADLVEAFSVLQHWWQPVAALPAQAERVLNLRVGGLYHLPLPLRASAEFYDVFPDAANAPCRYHSLLAGSQAWLPRAVDDFFANGGDKLWLIRVPEWRGRDEQDRDDEGQQHFLPASNTRLHDTGSLTGIAAALAIPTVALVALPDLERLQIPARLPDIPRNRLSNPAPQFLPCADSLDDDHRERRYSSELADAVAPRPLPIILRQLLRFIAADEAISEPRRPDVQLLFSMPLSYAPALDSPVIDPAAVTAVQAIRDSQSGHALRHVQFLFPYLRSAGANQSASGLHSPVGVVAGMQAAVARRAGPWRSMASEPLQSDAQPYPRLSSALLVQLREEPGIGVLYRRNQQLFLDDERLTVPALPPADYAGSENRHRYDGFRAGEVMRFLGHLRRQLRALGEVLIFNSDARDPRPRLLLEQFFRRLHSQGALRGALPEQAFSIQPGHAQDGVIAFDIVIAPAFPIDKLTLTFANLDGDWHLEVSGV